MNLSTRLTIAMVSLVLLTAAAVGYLSYRNLEATIIPAEATRLDARARMQAAVLDSHVRWARADVLASTGPASLDGYLRAHFAGGVDPRDSTKESVWRERYARNFAAQLKAKPEYNQFRLIGIADGGREIVRVDRSGPGGTIRIAPDSELQPKGDRPYFKDTIRLRAGEIYVAPIELNQERGVVQTPHLPVIRVGTPIYGPDGKPFGIIIINIDMRPAFAELRGSAREGGQVYLVNEAGDYLVHPDASREFGYELGRPYGLQNEFPALVSASAGSAATAHNVRNRVGEDFVIGSVAIRLAGGPQVTIIDSLPLDVVLASAATVGQSTLIGALIAALCASLLAAFTARSLVQPLRSLAKSIEKFTGEEEIKVPLKAGGEIGVFARTLKRMADAVREKTGALQDEIEERRRAEITISEFAEREKLYIAAVKSANDAIFTSKLDGTLTSWNPAAERLFGYTAEEAIGRNVAIIATPDQRAEQKGYLERIARGECVENVEALRVNKFGAPIEVSFNFSPVFAATGEVIGGSAIARDITERKRHEQAMAERALELQRSNEELEQFAYVASHDLQEPLRMVASYAELLADRYQGKLDDKADKYIGYAVDGAKRMQRLVNDLLTYSRVGTQGHPPQPTDAATVAGHALRALKHKIDDANAKIEIESLPVVKADESQLGQVFQNLIGNALKFRSSDRPLRVRIGAQPSRYGWTFFVEDNGIGIDAQYAERVFQMFQRLHDREAYEGSGIGLTITKKIVERHGGRIWFESEPGKGTTFFFTMPAKQEKAA